MSFIKRAKILATRVYEFFEGGDIDTIANSPDKLVWRTNRTLELTARGGSTAEINLIL
jgi:hypothetical protein